MVRDLVVRFDGSRPTTAIAGVSFDLAQGEVLGLLGESGSGKSVTLRALLRLYRPGTASIGGTIHVDGADVLAMGGETLRRYRGGVVSMIFQEPGMAFDPVHTIGDQIVESIRAHERVDRTTARKRALRMLDRVGIPQAARRAKAYPHELSGGMRQRAMIALALACEPRLLLADEPTTALDASVQIQILLLLRELQVETGMAMVFVTHDIGAAVEVADRIAVMYAGRIVEDDSAGAIVSRPRHHYSAGLLASVVTTADRGRPLATIRGAPPDLAVVQTGCAFAPRCDGATSRCRAERPRLVDDGGGLLACWHPVHAPVAAATPQ